VSVVASTAPERLAELSSSVRSDLDDGESPATVIDGLMESGFDRGFAEWYVFQTAATSDLLTLAAPFAAYPRGGNPLGYKESARDLKTSASGYRLLLWSALLTALAGIAGITMSNADATGGLIFAGFYIAAEVLTVAGGIVGARAIGVPRWLAALMGVASAFVPCCFAVLLVVFRARISSYLRKAGVTMGFLGPVKESFQEAIRARIIHGA